MIFIKIVCFPTLLLTEQYHQNYQATDSIGELITYQCLFCPKPELFPFLIFLWHSHISLENISIYPGSFGLSRRSHCSMQDVFIASIGGLVQNLHEPIARWEETTYSITLMCNRAPIGESIQSCVLSIRVLNLIILISDQFSSVDLLDNIVY